MQDLGSAHAAREAFPAVDVRTRSAGTVGVAVIVLGPDGDDATASDTDGHEVHEIEPDGVPLGSVEVLSGPHRVDLVPE